jgi:hypothetical protein
MKATKPILPRILKITFAVLESLTVLIVGVILALLWLLPPQAKNASYDLGEVQFVPSVGPATLVREGGEELKIKNLHGTVMISDAQFPDGLGSIKWAMVPLILVNGGFFFVLCDLLRRLFRNVQGSESFSGVSIRLVRRVGLTILVFTLLSAVTQSYFGYRVLRYLGPSGTLMGQEVLLTPAESENAAVRMSSAGFQFSLNFSSLLGGLVVLALSEVFRQGRQLQEENQLTI